MAFIFQFFGVKGGNLPRAGLSSASWAGTAVYGKAFPESGLDAFFAHRRPILIPI
jgi:hypothetical protein